MNWQRDGIVISTDKQSLDTRYIHEFLSNHSYWAAHIPYDTVCRSIEGSLCFGVFEQGRQKGFARVITDQATFAYLADVFIDPACRGRGLGQFLLEVIVNHPRLQGLRSWMLATRDVHGLYARFGFEPLEEPQRFMRKADPGVYKKAIS